MVEHESGQKFIDRSHYCSKTMAIMITIQIYARTHTQNYKLHFRIRFNEKHTEREKAILLCFDDDDDEKFVLKIDICNLYTGRW